MSGACVGITMLVLLQAELKEVQRYLLYCRGLKFKGGNQQVAFWREHVQLGESGEPSPDS